MTEYVEGETEEDRREQALLQQLKDNGTIESGNAVTSYRPVLKMPRQELPKAALDILADAREAIAAAKQFTSRPAPPRVYQRKKR